MSFYRRIEERIEIAEQSVSGPGFDLRADEHAQHRYPVHGWYWFDSLDEAMDGLPRFGKPEPTTPAEIWAVQAAARKDRKAKAALALPDSTDPETLRRKLNAALHLIQR